VPLIRVIRKLDEQLAIIEVPTQIAFDTLKRRIKIAPAHDLWKLSPPVEKLLEKNKDGEREYILTGMKLDDLLTVLQNEQKHFTILVVDKLANSIIIKCRTKYVRDHLLGLKAIIIKHTIIYCFALIDAELIFSPQKIYKISFKKIRNISK
jgi:hypothetical protein